MTRQTVLLGMSGGVDSSVAASLLVQQGYDVHGITLQVWEQEDEQAAVSKRWEERGCCKIGIAKFVAQRLGIPYEVVDRREIFQQGVIDDFVAGYAAGTTPNPCVRCNERVKLRSLYALAQERGMDYVATGHYARVQQAGGQWSLHRALDARKDQSYFLYRIQADWLPKLLFPVGEMQKTEVWKEAESLGLPVEELKESQEICFVSQGDYRTFLEQERPELKQPGSFVGVDGEVLGRHEGIAFYTPGQRRGLGIAVGQRLYVQKVVPESGDVVLCAEDQLVQSDCHVGDLSLLDAGIGHQPVDVDVKIRYATPPAAATLLPSTNGSLQIRFHQPQRALSPGQSAVFYRGDHVLGGGIIQRS
ncbi:MAG: tRNA 2-thiouridine(34) synthase MnmA [Nitrospira sp.]|jgi:tRNA-specific 2-thiouridylase|nr:tRNA 2-thiouridine(34) synthase MnmA [Nitrospira sp.]